VNSRLSYGVDTGDRKIPSVHISLLKSFQRESESLNVARATTVMDEDVVGDEIGERYAEVKVSGAEELSSVQRSQVEDVLGRYSHILTKEPGLTDVTTFHIDTGEHAPTASPF